MNMIHVCIICDSWMEHVYACASKSMHVYMFCFLMCINRGKEGNIVMSVMSKKVTLQFLA